MNHNIIEIINWVVSINKVQNIHIDKAFLKLLLFFHINGIKNHKGINIIIFHITCLDLIIRGKFLFNNISKIELKGIKLFVSVIYVDISFNQAIGIGNNVTAKREVM